MEKMKFKFKYIFPDDYNPIYVNGAYGGISYKAEIIVHFFLERTPLPNSVTHIVNEDGTLGEEVQREPEDHATSIVRYVNSGIILNLEEAKSVHKWLGDKIETLENAIKMQKDKKEKSKNDNDR